MKKIALAGATLAMVLAAGSASAANSMSAGTLGLNVSVVESTITTTTTGGTPLAPTTITNTIPSPLIAGKYFVAKDMAILGGFGFSSGGPSGNSVTTFVIEAGVRKYMNTNDFSPFVGGIFDYASTSTNPSSSAMGLAAEAGAEYFLAKQFSIEGKVRFGYTSQDSGGSKASYFGTSTAGLSANFYF